MNWWEIVGILLLVMIAVPITVYFSTKLARSGWLQANRLLEEDQDTNSSKR